MPSKADAAFNLGDMFEHIADAVPDRPALICRDRHYTFAELDRSINRFANALIGMGMGPGDHFGVYAQNSPEWIIAMLAGFKTGAVAININYRYMDDELAYLFDNADLKGVLFQRSYAPRVAAVAPKVDTLEWFIAIDHMLDDDLTDEQAAALAELGALDWGDVCLAQSSERPVTNRSGDDLYMLYTGGTTGMPKGVMWRQADVFFALGGGIHPYDGSRCPSPTHFAENVPAEPMRYYVIPPMMHGAAQWGLLQQILQGHTIVLAPEFDAQEIWETTDDESVNVFTITGDAMAQPLLEEWDTGVYDGSSLFVIASSAAVFSPALKARFRTAFPNAIIVDAIGSSESGFNGLRSAAEGDRAQDAGGPTVNPSPDTIVVDEELRPLEAGSPTVGKVARSGNIPIGYYKDPEKTAKTFVEVDGVRYVIPGDFARHEADGTITLLGRGSVCINSGGEKIYPEEVEGALKEHPAVYDTLVVGVPDERWGQRVAAVVEFRSGQQATLEDLMGTVRERLAGYKVPRELHVVDKIVRSPSGKPDYPWAKGLAAEGNARVAP